MKKETIATILRGLFTVITTLLLIPQISEIPCIGQALEAIGYIQLHLDELYSLIMALGTLVSGFIAIFFEVQEVETEFKVGVKTYRKVFGFGFNR